MGPGCVQHPHEGRGELGGALREKGSSVWGWLRPFLPPSAECPAGTFGVNCSGSCSCRGAPCNRVTGQCLCPPGRTGDDCGAGEWQACSLVPSRPCDARLWVWPRPWAMFGEPSPGLCLGALTSPGVLRPEVCPQQLQERLLNHPWVWAWGSAPALAGRAHRPRGQEPVGHGDRLASRAPSPSLPEVYPLG